MEINHHSYHIFKHKYIWAFWLSLGEAAGCSTLIWQSFTRTILVRDRKNTQSKSAAVPAAVMIWKALKLPAWEVKPEASSIIHPPREPSCVLGCQQENTPHSQEGRLSPFFLAVARVPCTSPWSRWCCGALLPHQGQRESCHLLELEQHGIVSMHSHTWKPEGHTVLWISLQINVK